MEPSKLPLESIHWFNQKQRDAWVQRKAAKVPPGSVVLDAGAGPCPYKGLFAHCRYYAQDFMRYEGYRGSYGAIDIVSSIEQIPVPDSTFDVVLCTEVLEHVPEPIEAVKELVRVLKPGGKMFLTAPLGSGLHQLPYHFYGGYTPEWYKRFLTQFGMKVTEISPNGGFFKHLAQECARFAWTFERHKHLHGANAQHLFTLFNETLPRYLFALDDHCFIEEFTIGYNVEAIKPAS